MVAPLPLVVDLDGSLLRSDSLHEALAAHVRRPRKLVEAAVSLRLGKARFKRALGPGTRDTLANAPLNASVLALIDEAAHQGRRVVIATGADATIAETVAGSIDNVSEVIASDGVVNLTGARKADELVARYGRGGFDYVGNAPLDAAIWAVADRRYLATTRPAGLPGWARGLRFDAVLRDPRPSAPHLWARALRLHQSLKNLLLFLPLLAAHSITDPSLMWRAVAGFLAFTLMASAVYLVNDTLDMAADRAHPRKRRRPIAAGWISPLAGLSLSVALTGGAIAVSSMLGPAFLSVLIVYALMTTAYSFWLKRVTVVDIVVLALLYMVRIVAGAVATGVALSFWFTGVTLFLFLSLALVKRYSEAHQAREAGRDIRGRGYSGDDVHAILALGAATGVAAVLLMAIYIQSTAVTLLYPAPGLLWLVIPILFGWIAHLWIMAGRGNVHDDPLVFALRDPASLVSAAVVLAIFFLASLPVTATLIPFVIA